VSTRPNPGVSGIVPFIRPRKETTMNPNFLRTSRRQLLKLSGMAMAAPALAGGALVSTKRAARAQETKELRFIGPEVTTLDSYQYSGGWFMLNTLGLKEGIADFDDDWNVRPLQAEGWEAAPDGLSYTITLRQDNKWFDGSPVTATDYVTSVRYQMTPGQATKFQNDSPYAYLENALDYYNGAASAESVGAVAVDDYTLQFKLERPYPAFITVLAMTSCFPMHTGALEQFGDKWSEQANFQGNGPYMIDEWVLQSHISVVPNPTYNLERGNLEKVTLLFQGRPLEAYEAGEIDLATLATVSDTIVAQNDETLSKELFFQDTTGLEYAGFLNNENGFYYDKPKVRQAIAKSFDTEAILAGIWAGTKVDAVMLSEPIQPDYDAAFAGWAYDPDGAKQLLEEAGYPNGEGLEPFRLFFPSYQTQDYVSSWTAMAQQVKENIGLEITLQNEEIGIYGEHYQAETNQDPWFGVAFMASGKPWKDVMHAWDQPVLEFAANDAQMTYAALLQDTVDLNSGAKTAEGADTADFDGVIGQITSLRDEALAVYADGAHGDHLKTSSEQTFAGWLDQATTLATAGKAGTDAAANWQKINETLSRAKAEHHLLTNRRPEAWSYYEWREAALWASTDEERLGYAKQTYDLHAQDSWHFPLWITVQPHLVKPYVTGARRIPFWWANVYQAKTISIT
jgi:ABC-type oligopeptide transport system substrate-binding subunit